MLGAFRNDTCVALLSREAPRWPRPTGFVTHSLLWSPTCKVALVHVWKNAGTAAHRFLLVANRSTSSLSRRAAGLGERCLDFETIFDSSSYAVNGTAGTTARTRSTIRRVLTQRASTAHRQEPGYFVAALIRDPSARYVSSFLEAASAMQRREASAGTTGGRRAIGGQHMPPTTRPRSLMHWSDSCNMRAHLSHSRRNRTLTPRECLREISTPRRRPCFSRIGGACPSTSTTWGAWIAARRAELLLNRRRSSTEVTAGPAASRTEDTTSRLPTVHHSALAAAAAERSRSADAAGLQRRICAILRVDYCCFGFEWPSACTGMTCTPASSHPPQPPPCPPSF